MSIKKFWYNMRSTPFYEGWIIESSKLVKKIVQRKEGQEYLKWKKNGFLLPRVEETNIFRIEEKYGTILFYNLQNSLPLKLLTEKNPSEEDKKTINIKRTEIENAFLKKKLIGYLNPEALKILFEEHSAKDIIAPEKTFWEEWKMIILAIAVMIFIGYFMYFYVS